MIKTGKIDKIELNKLFEEAIQQAKTDSDFLIDILPVLVETGKINENWINLLNKFFKEAVEQAKTNFDSVKYILLALIRTGKIDEEELNKFFKEAIQKAKTNSDFLIDILPVLIKTGKINERELNKFFKEAIQQAEINSDFLKYILPALIKTGKIDEEELNKFFKEAIQQAETDPDFLIYILPELIETIKIDEKELNKFFKEAIQKAETDFNWANYILPALLKTGKINKNLVKKAFELAVKNEWEKVISLCIKKWIFNNVKNNYSKLYKEWKYKKINKMIDDIWELTDKKIDIIFLRKNALNKDLLIKIKNFLENYWDKLDKKFFWENIEKIIKNKHWIEYWYFIEATKNGIEIEKNDILEKVINKFKQKIINVFSKGKKLTSFVTYENFIDFVVDEWEKIIEFEKDNWMEFEWITQPWTKQWFEEDPKRKEYLKPENIKVLQKHGTVIGLYLIDWVILKKDNSIFVEELGFKLSIKNYIYLALNNSFEQIKKLKITNNIEWLNNRNLELIWWYLDEYGISFYYFIKDLNDLDKKIDVKILIKLLKNKLYPTKNITDFILGWWDIDDKIQKLINIKGKYKNSWWFNIENNLHLDLEYFDFRIFVDKALKNVQQVWKWYDEYLQLIHENYEVELDEEKYYKQAWEESYIAKKFIDKLKQENEQINIFPNMSYWKVIVAWIKKELENDKYINLKNVRIWSTECNWKISYLKIDLFTKEDIKNLFNWDSIILDGTYNTSFWASSIWFNSYFYVLNKVLFDITGNEYFISNYNNDFIEDIKENENYIVLYNYLKNIIEKNKLYKKAKKFEFLYVSQNSSMKLRNMPKSIKNIDNYKNKGKNTIKIYFWDFVKRIWWDNWQAYFDDKHITDFKLIPTEEWLSYVDTKFKEKIKKYTEEFEELKKYITFYVYKEKI